MEKKYKAIYEDGTDAEDIVIDKDTLTAEEMLENPASEEEK